MGVSLTTNLWYGASSVEFHTIPDAAMSVLLAAIGDFRTTDLMKDYRHPQSEVILLVWSLVMGFIVLTMFVAIVDEGFQDAKDLLNPKPKTGESVVVIFRRSKQTIQQLLAQFQEQQDAVLFGTFKDDDADNKERKKLELHVGEIAKSNVDNTFEISFNDKKTNAFVSARWFAAIEKPNGEDTMLNEIRKSNSQVSF